MKKGFTLIELLAVIVILATVALIVFPNINAVILSSKQTLHDNQIEDIHKASEKWATDHIDLLDETHVNIIYVSLDAIKGTGYLEKEEIVDPLTKENMKGCLQIKYDMKTKKYNHTYEEKTCEEFAQTEDDGTLGYIIYEYDTKQKQLNKSTSSNEVISTGKYIYNWYVDHNIIYSDGQEISGLYELDNQYVFRGNDVNNYIEFAGKTWRILSINKKDYSMKLIAVTSISNQFDQGEIIQFQNASSNVNILKEEPFNTTKIKEADFNTDVIDGTSISRRALESTLGKNTTSLEIGIISVMDYVDASATLDCTNNYLSSSCAMNNYLYTMLGSTSSTWTLNNNGSQVWYIDTDGLLKLENPTSIKQLYPVIYIESNTYITNPDVAVGSISSPYKVK